MKLEDRPTVYFPSMTENEVVCYAETYAETALEKCLLELLLDRIDNHDEVSDYAKL